MLTLDERHPASLEAPAAAQYASDGLRVDPVLLGPDSCRQGLLRVAVEDQHCRLEQDGAGVEVWGDEVHGGTSHLHSVFQGLTLTIDTREGREQRRVHVEH